MNETNNKQQGLTVVVQAGGESRRMGQDKALLPFLGKPLIARVLKRLAPIADELVVTTNTPSLFEFLREEYHIKLAPDLLPGRGALGGLYTALTAASQPLAAVVACDMPLINPSLIAALRDALLGEGADIAIPHTGEGLEPFHAVYRREPCLPPLRAALDAGKWRADAWFDQIILLEFPLEKIKHYDPELHSFVNLNTPEEYQSVLALASRLEQENASQ